eukprot:134036-Rhodomonas_salina.1
MQERKGEDRFCHAGVAVLLLSVFLGGGPQAASSDFTSHFDVTALNGANGFRINGAAVAWDSLGGSVGRAGDINGDGISDFTVGSYLADNPVGNAGSIYVIFGTQGGFPAVYDLSALDGSDSTDGFRIQGSAFNDQI